MIPALTLSDEGITIRTLDASVHVMGPVEVTDLRKKRYASATSMEAGMTLRALLANTEMSLSEDDNLALAWAINVCEGTYEISREGD
ncbi:MAG TPA: hypothetical protein VGN19_05725 [Pedococcus sp.]|jgi:hypothetical protein|nr:hypothetical protein [Pedococcus sp.]